LAIGNVIIVASPEMNENIKGDANACIEKDRYSLRFDRWSAAVHRLPQPDKYRKN
jgi:hypothetical protein